eukprot:CAMPEP_0204383060 /NCGR_PEP_ID=MMETSP0469-20131031/55672_1 /ASSEMBLY_ACC=CAM_ASM_000384 /TAXON_ID=2969 /ORGANISM="Oxyrrhis marina" /LENGTH=132 /DNA_ID=CAMNT_0051375313 /DNA_START=168 /DNA_END=566 /DNA_ORIENTATION=-
MPANPLKHMSSNRRRQRPHEQRRTLEGARNGRNHEDEHQTGAAAEGRQTCVTVAVRRLHRADAHRHNADQVENWSSEQDDDGKPIEVHANFEDTYSTQGNHKAPQSAEALMSSKKQKPQRIWPSSRAEITGP